MKSDGLELDDTARKLLGLLTERASHWTGFRKDAVLKPAVAELLAHRLRGFTAEQLSRDIYESNPVLVHDVCQAVSVGETYFFRTPEQIAFALAELPHRASPLQLWSAGCATGEEAYSLSAALNAQRPPIQFQIIGTDLVDRNIELAKRGLYGRWSVRGREAVSPTFKVLPDGRCDILPEVRARVAFFEHNLLEPAPVAFAPFDVIFCRNVLVYFSRPAAERVLAHLTSALAPGGMVVFGSMDVTAAPRGLRLLGPPELQTYVRVDDPRVVRAEVQRRPSRPPTSISGPAPSPPSRPPIPAPSPPSRPPIPKPTTPSSPPQTGAAPAEPVALHLQALSLIERSDVDGADRLLRELASQRPDYLPALLERALLHLRTGDPQSGKLLMRDLLARTQQRSDDEILAAPEPMTVAFVRASARAALKDSP